MKEQIRILVTNFDEQGDSDLGIPPGFHTEIINQGNLDLLDELVAEDFVEHEAFPGLPTTGPEAPRAALGMFMAAFPDIQFTPEEMIAEGDKVVTRFTMSGTHKASSWASRPGQELRSPGHGHHRDPRRQGNGALGRNRSGSDHGAARDRTRDVIFPGKLD